MPELCHATLAEALYVSAPRLWAGTASGLAGILGWGLAFEWIARERLRGASVLHAFVEGTVIVALLRLLFSYAGFCNPSVGIAAAGIAIGAYAAWRLARSRALQAPSRREGLVLVALAGICLPLAARIAAYPMPFGDLTAIWTYHAKALTCECLLSSHYATEACWTGTHPNYPLYLSYLHSYFFTLTGSFRDDWVKAWQSALFVVATVLVFERLRASRGSALLAAAGASGVAALFAVRPLMEGSVEGHVVIFAALVAICAIEGDRGRLPLYLFGLLFSKHEGIAIALLFVVVEGLAALARSGAGGRLSALRAAWGYAGPWLLLSAPWLFALFVIPDHHENYARRLLSPDAWRSGVPKLPVVWDALSGELLRWPWSFGFAVALLAAVAGVALLRRPEGARDAGVVAALRCLAVAALMLPVYFAVYVVSPWDARLYEFTVTRLMVQIAPFAALGAAVVAHALARAGSGAGRGAAHAALGMIVAVNAWSLCVTSVRELDELASRARSRTLGLHAYRSVPAWANALRLDETLPPAGRGALLGRRDYFTPNYVLYPRLLYPAEPHRIVGTHAPWTPWRRRSEVDLVRYRLDYVVGP